MTPAARLQAGIEILDEVIASAHADGPPADIIVTRYFKTRRYAGSSDRRAVRELVFRAIRRSAEVPASGRAAMLGLAQDDPEMPALFGILRGPGPILDGEEVSPARVVPAWLESLISPLVESGEWPALLARAPLDLRVNVARASRDELIGEFPGAQPTPISPWGLRLPAETKIDAHPAFADGLVDV
ncbi:MAG: RsmB/NOP family class I SAM-dependent RNA methyltransferase, partial [Sphingomicrobium sp.]